MPAAAIHLLIVEALTQRLQTAGGSIGRALAAYPQYAGLGAIGPDLFYLAAEPVPARVATTVALLERAAQPFAHLRQTLQLTGGGLAQAWRDAGSSLIALVEALEAHALEALLADVQRRGKDLARCLRPPLQDGATEEHWSWGDLLHYRKTGRFAGTLLELARASGRGELLAYAAGYLSHVAADALGHPFVNTIVGGPYRLHYWRHRLVENHMDAWTWAQVRGDEVGSAALDGAIDLGAALPETLQVLLVTALERVYAGDPVPAHKPLLADAYANLRLLLSWLTGGDWARLVAPAAAPGHLAPLLDRAAGLHQQVRRALVSLGVIYPCAEEADPALYSVSAQGAPPPYPRATVHHPDQALTTPPAFYPDTGADGLQEFLDPQGLPRLGPPWQPSAYRSCTPLAFITGEGAPEGAPTAVDLAADFLQGEPIPDVNLDGDPVLDARCWRACGPLDVPYRLQEIG